MIRFFVQALVMDDALWILAWAKAESAGTTVPLLNLGPVLQVAAEGQQVGNVGQFHQAQLLSVRIPACGMMLHLWPLPHELWPLSFSWSNIVSCTVHCKIWRICAGVPFQCAGGICISTVPSFPPNHQ